MTSNLDSETIERPSITKIMKLAQPKVKRYGN